MPPLYTHCPHCSFPAVIAGIERALTRYCRQCRKPYAPNYGVPESERTGKRHKLKNHRRRVALRSLLQRRTRSTTSRGPK